MSKTLTKDCKKILVRNPSQPLPNAKVTLDPSKAVKPKVIKDKKPLGKIETTTRNNVDLSKPKPNSSKTLAKEIKCVETTKTISNKCATTSSIERVTVQEKITKQMNFPQDQAVYKNLIPLCSKTISSKPLTTCRNPLPPKDKEPDLLDYIQPKSGSEYYYKVNVSPRKFKPVTQFNGLRLFKITQKW